MKLALQNPATGRKHRRWVGSSILALTLLQFGVGKYEYRLITGGIGHNLSQEDPQAFAKAIIDADKL
jgi:hypothetical protein